MYTGKIKEIKEDLKDIKYYYSRKKAMDESFRNIGYNSVVKKAEFYNELAKSAPPQLFDLYVALYINNHTQDSFAEAMCYARETINLFNKKLLLYFQSKILEMKGGEQNESL